jgi:subfamily B ATP-binding cassette protein MsbA
VAVAGYGAEYGMNWLANQIVVDLRQDMFSRIGGLPAKQMDQSHSSFIINKVMNDVTSVMGACTVVLTSIVRDSITLLGLMAWLFWLNWQLTVVFLLVVPLAGLIIRKFSLLMRQFSTRSMALNADLLQILQEMVEGYRTVKIFGGQTYESARFARALQIWKKQQMRISNAQAGVVPVTQTIASVAIALVVVVATHQTRIGELSTGAMVSYLTAALMLMPALRRLSSISATLQRGLAGAESVFALLDLPLETNLTSSSVAPLKHHFVVILL